MSVVQGKAEVRVVSCGWMCKGILLDTGMHWTGTESRGVRDCPGCEPSGPVEQQQKHETQ